MLCVILAIAFGLFAEKTQAQELFQVTSAVKDVARKGFYVQAEEVETAVNYIVYDKVKQQPTTFLICYSEGATPADDFLTVARKESVIRTVKEVVKVDMDDKGNPVVTFTDDERFEASEQIFFALQPGQKLEITEISGLTQNFFRVRTVPRDTPVSKKYGDALVLEQKTEAAVSEPEGSSGC